MTLQNDHVAIADLRSGRVTSDFGVGAVDLTGIDTEVCGLLYRLFRDSDWL